MLYKGLSTEIETTHYFVWTIISSVKYWYWSLCANELLLICLSPGYVSLLLFMATTPVLRSKMSKLIKPSEQG